VLAHKSGKCFAVSKQSDSKHLRVKKQERTMYNNEFEAFKAIKRDPMKLKDVTCQTYAVCSRAVRDLPLAFIYIKNNEIRRKLARKLSAESGHSMPTILSYS